MAGFLGLLAHEVIRKFFTAMTYVNGAKEIIEQHETEALTHRARQCSSTCYTSYSYLGFTNMDEDPCVEMLMCSSTPG